jgi:hypothetical protein
MAKSFYVRDSATGSTGFIEDAQAAVALPISGGIIDVTTHGASPSASAASNFTALQSAQAAVIAANGGGLWFPPGVYQVDTTSGALFDLAANIHVAYLGAGAGNVTGTYAGTSVIKRTAGTNPILRAQGTGNTGTTRGHVSVGGVELHGGGLAGKVCVFSRCSEVTFFDVRLSNALHDLLHATQLWNSRFVACFFYAGGNGTTPAVLLDAQTGEGSLAACNTVQFAGCEWEANTGTDLRLSGSRSDSAFAYGITFTNTKMERQVASATYPVIDLDYAARLHFAGFDISAGGTGTTSALVTSATDGPNDAGSGGIHFTGGTFSHTATPTYYLEADSGFWTLSAVTFNGAPGTSYVRIGSGVGVRGWRHNGIRFQDITKDVTDQRTGTFTAGQVLRRVPIEFSSGTEVALGWIRAWELADATTQKVAGVIRIADDYEQGAAITARVTWTSATTTGNVRWQFEHQPISNTTDIATTTPAAVTTTDSAPGTANAAKFTDFAVGANYAQGGLLPWSISRLGADAADTLADTVRVLSVDLIYRKRG